MTYHAEYLAAQAEDPSITGLHGNVHREPGSDAHPWHWTIDFATAAAPLGDTSMSSLEYGSAATHAEAVAAADAITREALNPCEWGTCSHVSCRPSDADSTPAQRVAVSS